MRILTSVCAAFALLGLLSGAASADPILAGQDVQVTWLSPDADTTVNTWNVSVGTGYEVSALPDFYIDLSDNRITIGFGSSLKFTDATFNGFRFADYTDGIPGFTSVTLSPTSTMVGFDASRIAFDGDTIWMNLEGLDYAPSVVASVDIGSSSIVPEPGSLALIGIGLSVLAARRRKRSPA